MSSPASAAAEDIAFLRSQPLASVVQTEIERRILSGEVKVGARLNELEITRSLGISRAPVRESLRTLEQTESELKHRIQQRMGEASKALFAQGSVTWKRSKDSSALDVAAALKENPELLDRFPLTRPGTRRFLIQTNS